jgi:hypothetical protein
MIHIPENRTNHTIDQAPVNPLRVSSGKLSTIRWVPTQLSERDFIVGFCARTRRARVDLRPKVTQKKMARWLGISEEAYRSYENLRPMPHFLIERFCRLTGIDIQTLYTGELPADTPRLRSRPTTGNLPAKERAEESV